MRLFRNQGITRVKRCAYTNLTAGKDRSRGNTQRIFEMKKNRIFHGVCVADFQSKTRGVLAVVTVILLSFAVVLAACSKNDSGGGSSSGGVSLSGGDSSSSEGSSSGGSGNASAPVATDSKPAPESDFEVQLNKTQDGANITGYTGPGGNVIIPAVIQGFPVREINKEMFTGAFKGKKTLTSVVIPEGVTVIGYDAFRDCSSLASVTIPDSVTEIGFHAFRDCSSLVSVVIPEGVKVIGDSAFENCSSLASVVIAGGAKIGSSAFAGCSSLASIVIPDSVTAIGIGAFYGCKSLTSFTIPEGVTKLPYNVSRGVFQGSGLTSIVIPDSVKKISAFTLYCSNLVTVTISPVEGREWDSDSVFSCPKLSLASQAAIRAAGYKGQF
jgi:hypothetical protein